MVLIAITGVPACHCRGAGVIGTVRQNFRSPNHSMARTLAPAPETDGMARHGTARSLKQIKAHLESPLISFEDGGGLTAGACCQAGGRGGGGEQLCGVHTLTPIPFDVNSCPRWEIRSAKSQRVPVSICEGGWGNTGQGGKVLTFYSYEKAVIKYWETIAVQNEN